MQRQMVVGFHAKPKPLPKQMCHSVLVKPISKPVGYYKHCWEDRHKTPYYASRWRWLETVVNGKSIGWTFQVLIILLGDMFWINLANDDILSEG